MGSKRELWLGEIKNDFKMHLSLPVLPRLPGKTQSLVDNPARALLHLGINAPDEFAEDAENEKLHPAQKQNKAGQRSPARHFGWIMAQQPEIHQPPEQEKRAGRQRAATLKKPK